MLRNIPKTVYNHVRHTDIPQGQKIQQNGTISPEDNSPSWTTWRYYSVRRYISVIRDYIPSNLTLGHAMRITGSPGMGICRFAEKLLALCTWRSSVPELVITIANFIWQFVRSRIYTDLYVLSKYLLITGLKPMEYTCSYKILNLHPALQATSKFLEILFIAAVLFHSNDTEGHL